MDPRMDRLTRRVTWICTGIVTYLALTADYGPNDNVQTSLRKSIKDLKDWFWTPSEKEMEEIERRKSFVAATKENKDP